MSNDPRSPESSSSSGGRCRALVESGSLCGEPTDFKIIEEFNRLYCERLDIAEASGRQELVVRALKEWVNDLNEANSALVDTIKKLEVVALSSSALCNRSNAEKTDESEKLNKELSEKEKKINCLEKKVKELNELLSEKECMILKINCELEDMKKCLESQVKQAKDKVEYLERRVDDLKSRNETCMNNASHCENELRLKEDEIFDLKLKLADYSKPVKTSKPVQSVHKEILDKLSEKEKQLLGTEKKLQNACEEIYELQSKLYDKTNELEMSGKIVCCATLQKPVKVELKEKGTQGELETHENSTFTDCRDTEIFVLKERIAQLKKSGREMQEVLTAEVAAKHDCLLAVKRDLSQLEEQVRQADKQTQFKDDIIKELRKEVKIARAKESFVEMLGLKESSRVQMKSKIDSLTAELEDKTQELNSLKAKLQDTEVHQLECQLTTIKNQLIDRERDMLTMCNKLDYVKKYIEKLHNDQDISIKCGIEALLHELNEDTEWRRRARRSVTSLSEKQPESIIIINRSYSLPSDTSQMYNNYSKGRNSDSTVVTNAVEQSRLKRIGELENCLDDANVKISHLKKEIQEKEHEIAQINFVEVSKTNITDASLSSKFDEFQRFLDECSAKLKQILLCFKQYPQTEQLFQDIEDYKKHLSIEEESLNRIFKMLDEIKNEVKSSHKVKNFEENVAIQSLEQIISSVIEILQKENEKEKFPSKKEKCPIDNAITLLCNAIATMKDLRKISPQTSPINETCSQTSVSFLIEKVITEMNRALNETKYQKEKLIASEENQMTDFSTFTNSLMTLEQQIYLYNSAIEKMKQEIKIVVCKTNKKGEQVKKQCEKLEVLGCLIQEIKCFVDKSDVPVNSYKLSGKINKLERNYFDAMTMKRSSEKKNECIRNKKYVSSQRECSSTPQLGQRDSDSELFHEGSFQDKSNIAQVLFYEIKKELELGGEIICEREKELNRLENKFVSFRSCSINISKELDCLKNCLFTEKFDLKQIIFRTEEIHQRLNAGIESLCRMLRSYDKERQKYEMRNTHFKWKVQVKLRELAETVDDLSLKLGELREINLRKFQRQFSSTDMHGNLSPQTCDSDKYVMSSTLQEGNISTMKETIMQQEDMIKTLNSEMENLKTEMEQRIKQVSSEKEKCEIKSQDAIKELQSKICQLQESVQQSSKVSKKYWVPWIYKQKQVSHVHEV